MLNKRIKQLRLSYSMNQVELAEKLSVSKQTVSNWENNNIMPSVEMLIKLADLFSVSTDYLLCREEVQTINIEGLTDSQISHIKQIISDIKK